MTLTNRFDHCTNFAPHIQHSTWNLIFPHFLSLFLPEAHRDTTPTTIPDLPQKSALSCGDASHPRFPLGLHRVHQAFTWSWWTAQFPALSYCVRPGRFTSLSLGSPPLPPAWEVLDFLFHATWAKPLSRLPRPILAGDQQRLPGLARSCDP